MRKILAVLIAGLLVFLVSGSTPAYAKGGGSSGGGGRGAVSGRSYSPPKVGTRVVVSQPVYNPKTGATRPAVTAKVPPAQTTGAGKRSVIGTPYSPSGYTNAKGQPTIYSPVTHTYVVSHSYFYSGYSMFGWQPFYGYYGCLYCMTGAYAYAPVPFAPVAWTQPSWAFDVEILLLVLFILWLLFWLGGWWNRRNYYREW